MGCQSDHAPRLLVEGRHLIFCLTLLIRPAADIRARTGMCQLPLDFCLLRTAGTGALCGAPGASGGPATRQPPGNSAAGTGAPC